jgi:hypothetical protein
VDVCFVTSQKGRRNIFELGNAIKFFVRLGQGATDTYEKTQKAFANDYLSLAQIFRWRKDFVNRREMVDAPSLWG